MPPASLARLFTPSHLLQLGLLSFCLWTLFHTQSPLIPRSRDEVQVHSPPPTHTQHQHHVELEVVKPPPKPRSCEICNPNSLLCAEIGEENVKRSVTTEGTNARVRRFLSKLRSGEPVKVSVIGGSVSKGQNLPDGEASPDLMHRRIYQHLIETFPHPEHSLTLGGIFASESNYFKFCFKEHIEEDSDLVLIELSVNDQLQLSSAENYEKLVRAVLDLPRQPAIIAIEAFGLSFSKILNGGDMHLSISAFYDIPTISTRNAFLIDIMKDPDTAKPWFTNPNFPTGVDYRHMGNKLHVFTGRLVSAYIDRQLCEMSRLEALEGHTEPTPQRWAKLSSDAQTLPPMMLNDKWDPTTRHARMDPHCQSTNSRKHKLVIPPGTVGWYEWASKPSKNYIMSKTPGSRITFPFSTSLAKGEIHVSYLRSASFHLGKVSCWVDDEVNRRHVLDGYWEQPVNLASTNGLRFDLAQGPHTLTCELLDGSNDPNGGNEFRFVSVMSS